MRGRQLVQWWAALAARLRVASTYAADSALAATVAIPVAVQFGPAAPDGPTALGALLNAGTVVPLVWRRRAPFAVAVTVAAFAVLVSAYHRPGQELQYGALVATYTVADLGRRWQRWAFLGGLIVILVPGALLAEDYDAPDFLLTLLLPLSAYALGTLARTSRARTEALQEKADQLAREREAAAIRAAAEERARIARDMHDLLAHAVAVMVVQAEAAPVVLRSDPDRAERAFDAIAEAGRDAMIQLRHLLGVLKEARDAGVRSPPPTVAAIQALVAQMASANLLVNLQAVGDARPLPADAEVAAYRIVQEALTNTMRHAGARLATVRLDWTDAGLAITVTDDGRDLAGAAGQQAGGELAGGQRSGGQGLIGIRKRAAACGGRAETGPAPDGGFQVRAWLPGAGAGTGMGVPAASAPDGPPAVAITA
jgi:signal transduction histidine kinase